MKDYDDEPKSAHDAFVKGFCAQQSHPQEENSSIKGDIAVNPATKGYEPAFGGMTRKPKRKM